MNARTKAAEAESKLTQITIEVDDVLLAWLDMQKTATAQLRGGARVQIVPNEAGGFTEKRTEWSLADEVVRQLKQVRANDPFAASKPGVASGPRGDFNPVTGTWG